MAAQNGTGDCDEADKVRRKDLVETIGHIEGNLNRLKNQVERLPKATHKMGGADQMGFEVGDSIEGLIVDDGSGTKHGDPMAKTDGVVTFLSTNHDVEPGQTVKYVISEKDENHANGVITDIIENE